MTRRRLTIIATLLVMVAGLIYFQGPAILAPRQDEALRYCSNRATDPDASAGVDWRAGFPSGWWCHIDSQPEDTYLFWWN